MAAKKKVVEVVHAKGRSRRDRVLQQLREMAPSSYDPKTGRKGSSLSGDMEEDHLRADDLLLELVGDAEIADAFRAISKVYA